LVIYFDNAATSFPKPEVVYDAVDYYYRYIGTSSGRGAYRQALRADEMVLETRNLLGQLFNIKDVNNIVFTANITESLNLALKGLLQTGDHVITSQMEHNAMWRPLKVLEKEKGIEITVIPCPEGRAFDPREIENNIRSNTRLVALNHASNVTGTIMPIKEAGEICNRYQLPLLVDTAQTAGVYPLDLEDCNINLLAFTGHKGLLGPTGTGGLYIEPGVSLKPLKDGGTGGDSMLEHQPEDLPERFEAGTLNLAGIAGLGASVKFLLGKGIGEIRAREKELTSFLLELLNKLPGITVYGPQNAEDRVAVLSFNLENVLPGEAAYILDEVYGIMVRSGLHCAPQAHRCLGTEEQGTVRVGLGYFNTPAEVKQFFKAVKEIAES